MIKIRRRVNNSEHNVSGIQMSHHWDGGDDPHEILPGTEDQNEAENKGKINVNKRSKGLEKIEECCNCGKKYKEDDASFITVDMADPETMPIFVRNENDAIVYSKYMKSPHIICSYECAHKLNQTINMGRYKYLEIQGVLSRFKITTDMANPQP